MQVADLISRLECTFRNLLEGLYLEEGSLEIEAAILELASHERVKTRIPGIEPCVRGFRAARQRGDDEERERALHELYLRLHSGGALYLPREREKLADRGGYTCLPAGLWPILCARHLVEADTTVADLGAGNGLQCLLLQRLQPHRRAVQVELSTEMIRMGRLYREVLGIDERRVSWIHGDISDAPYDGIDLFYLYRPAKPTQSGNELYRTVAEKLLELERSVVVLSVADHLERFLVDRFEVLFANGHVTVFRNRIR